MTNKEKAAEIAKKLKSAEELYNHIAKENRSNKELATGVLNKIKKYKAELATLNA